MTGHLIEPAIKELIEKRDFTTLHEVFAEWTPAEIADCIVDFPPDEQVVVTSARTGEGIDELRDAVVGLVGGGTAA